MLNGLSFSQLTIPSTESAIAGAIAFNPEFSRLPQDVLVTPSAFVEKQWRIVYGVALSLRKEGAPVNAQTVTEYIGAHGVDTELQDALDSSKIINWQTWADYTKSDLLLCRVSHLEAALDELARFYVKRQEIEIGERLSQREISSGDAIVLLQNLPKRGAKAELFVDLEKIIAGGLAPERPTVANAAGRCLLYAGRLNEIHGEPSVGKTNVALSFTRCVIEDGGHVIYIDPEDTPVGLLSRLASMGADVRALQPFLHYLHNPAPAEFSRAISYAEKHKPSLVLLDGLAEALAAEGKDENEVGDVLMFFRERLRPFAEAGVAVLIADHVTKSTETRGRWARGTGAKLGRYDGVSYSAELIEAYSPTLAGEIRLRVSKDRNGAVGAVGQIAMELHFTPGENGLTLVEFQEPQERKPFKPTAIMAKICEHLQLLPNATKNDLRKLGKHEWVDKAISELVGEGKLRITKHGQRRFFELQAVPLNAGAQYSTDTQYLKDAKPL